MALHHGCWLALTGAVLAQGTKPVQGLLRDPSGGVVAGATVRFLPAPVPAVLALTGATAPSTVVAEQSDEHGVFRIASAGGPGTIFASTARGLGALALECQPGRAVRLVLAPMGELSAGGSEPIQAWPAAIDAEGRRHHLPMQSGNEIRLPAGTYEVWCDLGFGVTWQRVTLSSGHRTLLHTAQESTTLTAASTTTITPLSFPHAILASAEHPTVRLLGDARLATLAEHTREPRSMRPFLGAALLRSDSSADRVTIRVLDGGQGASAWLLDRVDHPEPRVLAAAAADSEGRCHLPAVECSADCWLLVTAPGRAPHTERFRQDQPPGEVKLHVGRTVQCAVTTPSGLPAVGVAVDFVPESGIPATLRARTDDRGIATFAHLHGAGELRIDDAGLGAARRELASEDSFALTLDEGAVVEGTVVDAAGAALAAVTVQLREPGAAAPRERAITTDEAGRFRFVGLAEAEPVVLFAQQVRTGITWSGRAELAAPKRDVFIVLSNEDPKLGNRPPR